MSYRRGFTLIEVLVILVVMGIAAAMVIPSMGSTGVLRVQAGVRTIVSDITYAQSDALAVQRRRALVFTVETNSYTLVEVNGPVIDPINDALYDPDGPDQRYIVDFDGAKFGGAIMTAALFDGDGVLIFDEMGGPVLSPDSDRPGDGGYIRISGSGFEYDILVEAYTGRVTVSKVSGP